MWSKFYLSVTLNKLEKPLVHGILGQPSYNYCTEHLNCGLVYLKHLLHSLCFTYQITWLWDFRKYMTMLVFLNAEAVFTHIIVGTLLAFVTGAHNGEQITFITPTIRTNSCITRGELFKIDQQSYKDCILWNH